ncbi:secondary thiamine-phosphate synthase enzyme YjbQ [Bacteroidota bacterium]
MITQKEIELPRLGRGYHLISDFINDNITEFPQFGLLNLFLKHTSAALSLNENADPSVREDFESFMNRLIPEDYSIYSHTSEGLDDMPAHIKSSFFGTSLTIPITNHKLNTGIWQGIYLCEFRKGIHQRNLVFTIYS